ncbi:MAG TPA: STN domain-containing protein, partial [Pirellulales bacterium]|nr:STN domain-containing protein [Pirellulales bacterium]
LPLIFLVTAAPVCAAAQDPSGWLTGVELERQKEQPVTLNWTGVGVRQGLASLAKAERVAILLDRRIDPERPVDFVAKGVKLAELPAQIAEKVDGAATWFGPLAYVGPRDAAERLRTLAALRAADVRALPKPSRTRFERESAWKWDDLAEPRELVSGLAAEVGLTVENLDLMPHDLWPAADLPPLSWTDRLTLVANEFDLTFQFSDDSRLRLIPIVAPVVIERSYPAVRQASELAARWRRQAPHAQIDVRGDQVIVRARLEDHELLHPARPAPSRAAKGGVAVYTLTVPDQPLSAVLDKLREAAIDIVVDEAALKKAKLSVDRRVSFSVERATLEELLEAALKPAGLTFERKGKGYRIVPAD